ncbi:hypothetical protein AWH48_11530 [Domibacillus aminovorans]|uniref:Rho termination factor-like N-terminal domain-containing protein n=1 Tax=Domibacillus aminovorans TaxID=29332 RepID=A0A177KKI5_9BACI|nr:Rho termination factor N-terminal domain-containing protein [Domibacillus aminovorans]OAH53892.1 hypothetical protein AWH48_11530 [Domibacillus aminovorans]
MKFYGHGIVWDKDNDKALCTFENGEYETDDQRTIDLLTEAGVEHDVEEPMSITEMGVPDLKKLAKQQGIEGYSKMDKEELLASLGNE